MSLSFEVLSRHFLGILKLGLEKPSKGASGESTQGSVNLGKTKYHNFVFINFSSKFSNSFNYECRQQTTLVLAFCGLCHP